MVNQYKKKKASGHKLGEVVSVVSHQLKTPLAGVKGYLEVLLSGDLGNLNPGQEEYLQYTLNNVNRMIRLVKDFLDVSRIEQDRMEFKPQPTDVTKIVQETIEDFSSLARAKNCVISFQALDEIPALVINPIKIKQVITNIIFNAIEYNREKEKIEITLKKEGNKIIFCCKDEGIGISEDEKRKFLPNSSAAKEQLFLLPKARAWDCLFQKRLLKKTEEKYGLSLKRTKEVLFVFLCLAKDEIN